MLSGEDKKFKVKEIETELWFDLKIEFKHLKNSEYFKNNNRYKLFVKQ